MDIDSISFWPSVAHLAADVLKGDNFDTRLGYWQPGWVGSAFIPGKSVVIVMQNPATSGADKDFQNDQKIQMLLKALRLKPSEENYSVYRREFMVQMRLSGPNGDGWPKWRHFVAPLLTGLKVKADEIAWLNAVKPRFAANKITWSSGEIRNHATRFLFKELDLLQPAAVVSHGSVPRGEVDTWRDLRNANAHHASIPQPSQNPNSPNWTTADIEAEGRKIRLFLDELG